MPFKTPQASAESLRRKHARKERVYAQSVRLMNDTKWRKVLVTASRLELWFIAAFVGDEEPVLPAEFDRKQLRSPLPEVAFERHHIGDWGGMSGPYKDLLWVLFPARFSVSDEGGQKLYREQQIKAFLEAVAQLGKLPLEAAESFVRVYGYKSIAS